MWIEIRPIEDFIKVDLINLDRIDKITVKKERTTLENKVANFYSGTAMIGQYYMKDDDIMELKRLRAGIILSIPVIVETKAQ